MFRLAELAGAILFKIAFSESNWPFMSCGEPCSYVLRFAVAIDDAMLDVIAAFLVSGEVIRSFKNL